MPLGHAQVYDPSGYSSIEEEAIDVGAGSSQLDPEAVSLALGETCSHHVTTIHQACWSRAGHAVSSGNLPTRVPLEFLSPDPWPAA